MTEELVRRGADRAKMLRETDASSVADVSRTYEVSEQTIYIRRKTPNSSATSASARWRARP